MSAGLERRRHGKLTRAQRLDDAAVPLVGVAHGDAGPAALRLHGMPAPRAPIFVRRAGDDGDNPNARTDSNIDDAANALFDAAWETSQAEGHGTTPTGRGA